MIYVIFKTGGPALCSYPVSQVVGKDEVPWERLSKGFVKVEHFEELLTIDQMYITISESPNVGHRLAYIGGIFPEAVAEDIALA